MASAAQRGGPSVVSRLEVLGIDRRVGYLTVAEPGRDININGGLRRELSGGGRLRLAGDWNRRQQLTLLFGEVIVSPVTSARLRTELRHDVGSNLRLSWRLSGERSAFDAAARGELYNAYGELDANYAIGRWTLTAGCTAAGFDLSTNARFTGRLETTLRYHLDNSPWAFELSAATPLAGRADRNFRQSDLFFTTTDTRVFIAYVSGNVAYQF